MPIMNIDHAQTNLRWCARAWHDGEMRDLALFLFRKGLTQLVMTDLSLETQTEVAASVLGREAFEDLLAFNEQIESSSVVYNAWQSRVSCLVIC
jgi:hypothetical protein